MKRRMFPISVNGNALAPDEFGYIAPGSGAYSGGAGFNPQGIEAIQFRCPNKLNGTCLVHLSLGPQKDPTPDDPQRRWHWDGNMQEPTLSPSVNCTNRCGWHGMVVKGNWDSI